MPEPQVPDLTKVQRNELYKSIEKGGLDLIECELTQRYEPAADTRPSRGLLRFSKLEPARRITSISHFPSASSFVIEQYESGDVRLSYSSVVAGEKRENRSVQRSSYTSTYIDEMEWRGVVQEAGSWARDVKRECVDPDFWSELQAGRDLLAEARSADFSNTPFTPAEQTQIAGHLREIKEYVKKTYSLSAEQAARVEERFNDAEEASRRMGRKDWLLLFGGALLSLLLPAVVPPDAIHHILAATTQSLGHLFLPVTTQQLPPQK